jgi:hypothetical protein
MTVTDALRDRPRGGGLCRSCPAVARFSQTTDAVAPVAHRSACKLEEQRRLRKRIKELEEEVEILKRFTAYWVKETGT